MKDYFLLALASLLPLPIGALMVFARLPGISYIIISFGFAFGWYLLGRYFNGKVNSGAAIVVAHGVGVFILVLYFMGLSYNSDAASLITQVYILPILSLASSFLRFFYQFLSMFFGELAVTTTALYLTSMAMMIILFWMGVSAKSGNIFTRRK